MHHYSDNFGSWLYDLLFFFYCPQSLEEKDIRYQSSKEQLAREQRFLRRRLEQLTNTIRRKPRQDSTGSSLASDDSEKGEKNGGFGGILIKSVLKHCFLFENEMRTSNFRCCVSENYEINPAVTKAKKGRGIILMAV